MTEQEYKQRLKELETEHEAAKRNLMIEYAANNRKYKIGDIITNHIMTILIDGFSTYSSFSEPIPVYKGLVLRKDLTPRKDRERGNIYGNERTELIKGVPTHPA